MTAPLLAYYSLFFPEFLLMGLGVFALALSFFSYKQSPVAVYVILWLQLAVFLFTILYTGALPVPQRLPLLGLQALGVVIAWMTKRFGQKHHSLGIEVYDLMLASTAVLSFLVKASSLIYLFIALEVFSIFLSLLLALTNPHSPKTAFKYLVQSALSGVIMLWGMVLLYAATGSLRYEVLQAHLLCPASFAALAGTAFVIVGLIFKLGLFPFIYYLPQVYAQASYPALGFLTTSSKLAIIAALLKLFSTAFSNMMVIISPSLGFIAVLTLIWGALSALHQKNIKTLLGFSGSVHASFVLAALLFSEPFWPLTQGVWFYCLAYFPAILLILYALIELNDKEPTVESLKSLYSQRKGLSWLLILGFASLAGLPPLGGFMVKFLVFYTGVMAHQWTLIWAMILASVLGIYYYLRVIISITAPSEPTETSASAISFSTRIFAGIMIALILGLGLLQSGGVF